MTEFRVKLHQDVWDTLSKMHSIWREGMNMETYDSYHMDDIEQKSIEWTDQLENLMGVLGELEKEGGINAE